MRTFGIGAALLGCALLVVAVVGGGASAAEPGVDADRGARSYDAARQAYEAGDLDRAIEHLQAAIVADPKPVYVYNLGRAQEGAGRLRDAYDTFLRAKAMPTISDDLRQLAAAGVERLARLRDRAVVDVSGFPEGSIVQIDGNLVADPRLPQPLDPGRHQVCVLSPQRDGIACHARPLAAGRRASFPPDSGMRSVAHWPEGTKVTDLAVGGHRLLLPLQKVLLLELDAGRVELSVKSGDDFLFRGDVELLPGATQDLTTATPAAEPVVAEPEEDTDGGVGVGPWIVSGIGGATLVAGAVVWGMSSNISAPATTNEGGLKVTVSQTQAGQQAAWDEARNQELAGAILVGVGAAAVVGGVVWLLAGSGGESEGGDTEVTAAPWLAPESAGAVLTGRF